MPWHLKEPDNVAMNCGHRFREFQEVQDKIFYVFWTVDRNLYAEILMVAPTTNTGHTVY